MKRSRRGLTFIEVVLAAGLLGAISASILAAFTAVQRQSFLDQERLNAVELAHRLILTYIKLGPSYMPHTGEDQRQGKGLYRYSIGTAVLVEEKDSPEGVTVRRAEPVGRVTQNEALAAGLVYITVKVYPSPNQGVGLNPDVALATIARVYDPYDIHDASALLEQVKILMNGAELPGVGRR